MNGKITIASLAPIAAMVAALVLPGAAFAQHHGAYNGGGGGHSSGGGYHAAVGVHPPYNPGYSHGGYYHGGGYYYGGYYHPYYAHYYPHYYYPYYGALAFGVYVATLPYYYNTYWWGGVPYYYGDGNYYLYDDNAHKYEVVPPPEGAPTRGAPGQSSTAELFAYPKNNQSEDQQRTDRFECHQWAANQTGFDPTNIDASKGAAPDKAADYRRAETACLNGRGYSVK